MQIKVSKADYASLVSLTNKVFDIVRNKNPSVKEYNTARLLRQTVRKIERNNST